MGVIKIGIIENAIEIVTLFQQQISKIDELEMLFNYDSIEVLEQNYTHHQHTMPDIIFLDLLVFTPTILPATITRLLQLYPQVKIIVMAANTHIEKVLQVFKAGANGYVSTLMLSYSFKNIIAEVLLHGSAISPDAAALLVQHTHHKINGDIYKLLSKREIEIALAVVGGKSYNELAVELFVSVCTINHHLKNMYRKLEVKSKSQLIALLLSNPILQ